MESFVQIPILYVLIALFVVGQITTVWTLLLAQWQFYSGASKVVTTILCFIVVILIVVGTVRVVQEFDEGNQRQAQLNRFDSQLAVATRSVGNVEHVANDIFDDLNALRTQLDTELKKNRSDLDSASGRLADLNAKIDDTEKKAGARWNYVRLAFGCLQTVRNIFSHEFPNMPPLPGRFDARDTLDSAPCSTFERLKAPW